MRLDWDKVEELEKQKGDEVRKKVIKILKQLDSKLKKQNKMERIGLCIVEYKELGNKDKLDYERVILVWDKERGYYFEGQEYRYDEWETREELDLIDFNKYKNLTIDNITSDIAVEIAKELPQKIEMLNDMLIEDLEEKEKILYELNSLKEKDET